MIGAATNLQIRKVTLDKNDFSHEDLGLNPGNLGY